MASRRGNTGAFSLFAFQDIITSVTGIMILVTLLFSLELTRKSTTPIEAPQPTPTDSTPQQVNDLEGKIKSLQAIYDENQALLERVAAMPAGEIASLEASLRERLAALEAFAKEISDSNQKMDLDASQRSENIEELNEQTLQSLEEELRRLQEEIQSTSKSSVVVYNPDPGATKAAWLIDLGKERIQAFPIGGGPARTFPVAGIDEIPTEFTTWVRQRDNSQEYFVLLLRPESIVMYAKLHPLLDGLGFELGFDLIDTKTDAQATLSGAGD